MQGAVPEHPTKSHVLTCKIEPQAPLYDTRSEPRAANEIQEEPTRIPEASRKTKEGTKTAPKTPTVFPETPKKVTEEANMSPEVPRMAPKPLQKSPMALKMVAELSTEPDKGQETQVQTVETFTPQVWERRIQFPQQQGRYVTNLTRHSCLLSYQILS